MASIYAPIVFPPVPVLMFKETSDGEPIQLVLRSSSDLTKISI